MSTELSIRCPNCTRFFNAENLRTHHCPVGDRSTLPPVVADKAIKAAQREADSMDRTWGYEVEIYFHNGTSKKFNKQGTAAAVRRWAILKTNHKSHDLLNTYTRRQWIACFGDGRVRM
jgi:hypothetical protein